MVWAIEMDGELVVGGDPGRRLTPNFRLREFQRKSGGVRVHRELVSVLQILRDRHGRSVEIVDTDPDGLGATIEAAPRDALRRSADTLAGAGLFAAVAQRDDGVHVRVPDPQSLPEIDLEQALETAFSVTAGFETSGDRFQQITGNFDGAGLSFGPAQWNFASGTLVPLFERFAARDEGALQAAFADPDDYAEWQRVLALPEAQQIAWATGISTGRGNHDVIAPWKGYFQATGRVEAFRAIMVEQALRKYGARMLKEIEYLEGLAPGVRIDHLRCVCALYDLVIQQGSLRRASDEIEARVRAERPNDQFALVHIAVEERGRKANPEWRNDCVSRRLGILDGFPHPVGGRQRANIHFYMLRDVCIRDAAALRRADVSEQLANVSQALASGGSLLA